MKKYRKKPIVIKAEQWFKVTYNKDAGYGMDAEDLPIHHLGVIHYRNHGIKGEYECKYCGKIMHAHGWMDTLEGSYIVCPGDWIIKGTAGEFYPIRNDIFLQTYEKVID